MKAIDFEKDTLAVISDDEIINVGEYIAKHKNLKRNPTKRAPKLEELYQVASELELQDLDNIDIVGLTELGDELSSIADNRHESYVTYNLGETLVIVLLAVLAGNDSWFDIEMFGRIHEKWLKKFLRLENGVPTDDTYRLIVSRTDMNAVYHIIICYLMKKIGKIIVASGIAVDDKPDIIAIDGKVSTSSARKQTSENEKAKPLNTLNAYSNNWGFCLDQEFIEEKSNEIPAAPILLSRIDLNGAIVTADAMNTQIKTAEAIIEQQGNYVIAVKGCKKYLYQSIVEYFNSQRRIHIKEHPGDGEFYYRIIEKEKDSIVMREYYFSTDISIVYKGEEWPELSGIGLARKTIISKQYTGEIREEFRHYICGGKIDIDEFVRSVRLHWGVENNLHWQLDFTFADDANKSMIGTGAEGLQLFKKACLAILKTAKVLFPHYYSLNNIRSIIAQDFEATIGKIFSILTIDNILEANMKPK